MTAESVDLLEALRTAFDDLEPLLAGRTVDIEMGRFRVVLEEEAFRAELGSLVASVDPASAITVRVARTGKTARIEVLDERDDVAGTMTVPLAPGASNAADA